MVRSMIEHQPLHAACTTLRDHFKIHFNKESPTEIPHELIELPNYLTISLEHIITDNINGDPPDETEIKSAVNQLKLRKSTTDIHQQSFCKL